MQGSWGLLMKGCEIRAFSVVIGLLVVCLWVPRSRIRSWGSTEQLEIKQAGRGQADGDPLEP